MSQIAQTMTLLALVAVLGLWMGGFKIKGVGLGIGGVLFGGIAVGHFANVFNIQLDPNTLHFMQEFGLILFVYTIGIQVGPGFFASLRSSGLKLNAFAALIVLLGCVIAAAIHVFFNVPLDVVLGVYSGAVTNTPSLGAGQGILKELGTPDVNGITGMAYALAYPFGICGILLSMGLVRAIFHINTDNEEKRFNKESGSDHEKLSTMNVAVTNKNLEGLELQEVPDLNDGELVCSRMRRGDKVMIPHSDRILKLGDILHLVGDPKELHRAQLVIGEIVDVSTSTQGSDLKVVRMVVTNEDVLGKQIGQLNFKSRYNVVISRLNRSGLELVPTDDTNLQFGDILTLVGDAKAINSAANIIGNAKQKLQNVQMIPIFVGIGLGVLLGSIPIAIPGFPAPLKLGLAGGPLIVALILSRIGSIGRLYWFMPPSANHALREIGIVIFLAIVGFKSGGKFFDTLLHGDGLSWMGYGVLITLVPLVVVGVLARVFGKLNYLSICGMMAGSMTDPPALALANGIKPDCGASPLGYATVYPLTMCLRILSPQILAIVLTMFS